MTKPSDFIINTDYLSIAQSGNFEFTASFAAQTYAGGYAYNRDQDFSIESIKGAVDRFMISRNGDDYTVGNLRYHRENSSYYSIFVYRPNSSTLRIRLRAFSSQPSFTVPAQTVKVKVSCFKPPNVF